MYSFTPSLTTAPDERM